MPVINEEIKKKARDIFEYMRDIRRTIHKKPEVGMKEFETAKLICSELKKMGIPYKEKVGGTGVVGLIKGNATGSGRCLGMRADMDALSVEERKEVEYASQIPGIMHACGHDGHVATLLGAAKILSQMKDEFSGSVKLIFQPAEEGPGGAKPMIKDGVLKDPDVDAIVAFHVGSGKITGNVGLRPGPVHAAQNEFHIKIKGVGGHAASPHKSVDAIVLAARAVLALQTIVSRKIDPLVPAVLTIGIIKGGYRVNIIADEVELVGTYRFLDKNTGMKLREWTGEILRGITKEAGGDFEIKYNDGYPPNSNDPELTGKVKKYLVDLLGEDIVYDIEAPTMGAEDFAYFAQEKPTVFMRLGAGGPTGEEFNAPHHHPEFDIDEKAFINGAASFVKIALEFLK